MLLEVFAVAELLVERGEMVDGWVIHMYLIRCLLQVCSLISMASWGWYGPVMRIQLEAGLLSVDDLLRC